MHSRRRRGNSRGQRQAKDSTLHKVTATTHTWNKVTSSLGLVTTVESSPRPPLPLLPPPLASATVPLTTPAETRTRPSQVPSALATDKPTAIRLVPRVRRQHCRGKTRSFDTMLVFEARPALSADLSRSLPRLLGFVVPYIRPTQRHSHTCFCEEATGSKVSRRCAATGACASSAAFLSQGTGAYALSAVPSATGARASGAAPLSYGNIQATGA